MSCHFAQLIPRIMGDGVEVKRLDKFVSVLALHLAGTTSCPDDI